MKKLLMGLAAILAIAALATAQTGKAPEAETPTEADATADVPELDAFHEIIHPMWHDAYPAQDTTMLRTLWPDIVKRSADVQKAKLPGILHEKQEAWKKGLERLHAAEMAYGSALAAGNKDALLKAAEEMHSSFEGLVRVIRPQLPELEDFHKILYMIYHHDVPGKHLLELHARVPALTAARDSLNTAELPKPREAKREEFVKARAALSEKVTALTAAMKGGEWADVVKAVEEMHTAYQGVEHVLE